MENFVIYVYFMYMYYIYICMYVCIVIDVNPKISLGFFTTSYKNLNERFGQLNICYIKICNIYIYKIYFISS